MRRKRWLIIGVIILSLIFLGGFFAVFLKLSFFYPNMTRVERPHIYTHKACFTIFDYYETDGDIEYFMDLWPVLNDESRKSVNLGFVKINRTVVVFQDDVSDDVGIHILTDFIPIWIGEACNL